jgi:hypothetical protein
MVAVRPKAATLDLQFDRPSGGTNAEGQQTVKPDEGTNEALRPKKEPPSPAAQGDNREASNRVDGSPLEVQDMDRLP